MYLLLERIVLERYRKVIITSSIAFKEDSSTEVIWLWFEFKYQGCFKHTVTECLLCDLSAVDLFSSAQTTGDTDKYSRGGTGRPFSTPSLFICLLQAAKYILKCLGHVPSRQDGVRERLADRRHAFDASREWSLMPCCHNVCVWKPERVWVYLAVFWEQRVLRNERNLP